ncbi:hypothetical protein HanPI659440_Chr13g0481651 [Helianthus annuus]|nr:hypothetical protein HanPI659440_Chr13g0481651 [Helianthus annuus]
MKAVTLRYASTVFIVNISEGKKQAPLEKKAALQEQLLRHACLHLSILTFSMYVVEL